MAMAAVVAILVVVSVSVLITRVGTAALALTGLPRQVARFQARSAFFGVGFTTTESETVVNHPVRRRIVAWLILAGNIGVISVLAGVVVSFHGGETLSRLAVLAGGLIAVAMLAGSHRVERILERGIERGLHRWSDLDTRDFAGLLRLAGDWSVAELQVEADDWLAGRTLGELHLRDEGIVVLGITHPDGTWHGAPDGTTVMNAGDVLVVYGRDERVSELDERDAAAGEQAHAMAVAEQDRIEAAERAA
jgi:hypothetical protein